jgi:cell division protein FtsN
MTAFDRAEQTPSAITISNRQLAAVLFAILGAMTAVTAVAYSSGRTIATSSLTAAMASRPVVPPLVIDPPVVPAGVASTAVAAAPAASPQSAPAAAAIAKPFVPPAAPALPPPAPGAAPRGLYFQVGSLEKGMANASREYLAKNGLIAAIVPGSEEGVYRVLVGPLTPDEVAGVRDRLSGLGFRYYLRRY